SSSSSKPAIKLSKKQRAALISQQPNRLTVTAVRGIGLIAKDTSGTSDPYITFEIFHQIQKTQRIDKTLDPVWNQTLTFMVPNLTEDISLNTTVWDWDAVGSHDFMGTVNIPLKSFLDSHAAIQGTYTLQSRPGKHDKVSGQIELRIEFLKGVNAEAETKIFFGPAPTIPIAVSSNYPPLKGKVGDKITIKIELRMVSTKALTDDMFGGELNCCFTNPDGSKTIVHASKNPNIVTHADRIKETGRFYIVFSPSAPGKVASLIRFNGEPMQRKEVTFTIAPGRSNVKIH
ncbi:MAG: C2 domain-containing protein, partial [archaeon]|nr:C2 domain-containing protein [archaeon]